MERQLKHSMFIPFDPGVYTYCQSEGQRNIPIAYCGVHPFEYTGWWDEMMAYHDGCAIHAGLNPAAWYSIKGPDAIRFMSDFCTNNFENFPIGKGKHAIMCNEDGYIVKDGIAMRMAEDEILTSFMLPYIGFLCEKNSGKYDIVGEDLTGKVFNYQLTGPKCLQVAERAANESLEDIPFICFRNATIAGKTVRIFRVGMSGTLAYEVHGRTEDALDVYNALMEAGKDLGIARIGRHAYRNMHVDGGFPQNSEHFTPAPVEGYAEYQVEKGLWGDCVEFAPLGSMGPDRSLRFVTPVDVGWSGMISLGHDFVGKEALAKEKANPRRKPVTLVWNPDDVVEVWRSVFDKENDPYMLMPLAEDFDMLRGSSCLFNDQILVGDEVVGMSCGRMFAPKFREMISLGLIDVEHGEPGTQVEILWGNPGTRQKRIRATVSRFPYIAEGRNQDVDTKAAAKAN